MERYQQRCIQELHDYDTQTFPDTGNTRPSLLCICLASVRLLSPTIIEELFFAGLIGSVEIGSIIPYIMRLDAVEYAALLRGGGIAVTTAAAASTESPSFSSYMQFAVPPAQVSSASSPLEEKVVLVQQQQPQDDTVGQDEPAVMAAAVKI